MRNCRSRKHYSLTLTREAQKFKGRRLYACADTNHVMLWLNLAIKMALSLGDFYRARTPARRLSSLSRDLNLSLQSQCSSYQLNEGLTQSSDLQVQFTDDDLETPFDSFTSSGLGAISTPEIDRRNKYHPAAGHIPCSLPLSPSQPTVPATNVIGMLQEQQGLQKLLREQQEIIRQLKEMINVLH